MLQATPALWLPQNALHTRGGAPFLTGRGHERSGPTPFPAGPPDPSLTPGERALSAAGGPGEDRLAGIFHKIYKGSGTLHWQERQQKKNESCLQILEISCLKEGSFRCRRKKGPGPRVPAPPEASSVCPRPPLWRELMPGDLQSWVVTVCSALTSTVLALLRRGVGCPFTCLATLPGVTTTVGP